MKLELNYEGKRIDPDVDISECVFHDRSGGLLDDLTIRFSDPGGRWGNWRPQLNERIEIRDAGFSTGVLFVDVIVFKAGYFTLKATPLKTASKRGIHRTWEKVKLLELAGEAAGELGLTLEAYGVKNWIYRRLEVDGQTFAGMLSKRCQLEGYSMKITDGKLLIINEKEYDQKAAEVILAAHEIRPDYEFMNQGEQISEVRVAYGDVSGSYSTLEGDGGQLEITEIPVWDIGEAERYAAGIARQRNRLAFVGIVTPVVKRGQFAAWTPVEISGLGWPDGKYLVDTASYDFREQKTVLRLRRPLSGY